MTAARSSSINASGSPLVSSRSGKGSEQLDDGMNETDTEVGEIVEAGSGV